MLFLNGRSIKSDISKSYAGRTVQWLASVSLAFALTTSPLITTSANAFENLGECTAEVTKIIQDLLKANMSSAQVNFVYETINQAEEACASGDFNAAEQAIETSKKRLEEATSG